MRRTRILSTVGPLLRSHGYAVVTAISGRSALDVVDEAALDFFRLTWDLKDLATYLDVLRAPHRDNEDTARALQGVKNCVASRDRWGALLD